MTESTQQQRVDLHGHEALPFPNFADDATYLERVTLRDENEARKVLARECGAEWGDPDEYHLHAIWMRYGPAESEREELTINEYGEPTAWWECAQDHPDAVPFWKDAEPDD